MNKILKITLAIIGAINAVVSMFIPIAIALVWTFLFSNSPFQEWAIILLGGIASVYRAISIGFIKQ